VGNRMRDPNSDVYARIQGTEADLDRFERQAATVLGCALALSIAIGDSPAPSSSLRLWASRSRLSVVILSGAINRASDLASIIES